MRKITGSAIVASCTVWLACGGGAPKPQNTTTLPIAMTTAPHAPTVDLSPVAMPPSAVVLVHAAHPFSSADVLSQWAGQPLDSQSALTEMVGERIAKVVDLDAPADLVVSAKDRGGRREPDMTVALSLPVKNFEEAKGSLQGDYGLLPIDNGAFEVQRSGGPHRDGDSDFRVCALAPAVTWSGAGAPMTNGARVVCSRDATARDALLPYLTRGTAGLASNKSDVHIEARPGPFRALVERERSHIMQKGSQFGFGGWWEAVLSDLCDGFLEAEKATIDANIDNKHGSAQLTITANGSHALVTRILTAHPERAEAPPATFLRLPSDADVALFAHGIDADQLAMPKETILRAVDSEIAEHEAGVKEADRRAIVDALGRTMDLLTLPFVYGRGIDFGKAVPAVSGLTDSSDAAKIRAGVEQAAGWDVVGIEAPAEKVTSIFKAWAAVLGRASVMHAGVSPRDDRPKLRVTGAPRGAPPGTVGVTLSVSHTDDDWRSSASGKPKQRPPIVLTLHTLIIPDHSTVWVVSALDEATAVAKARALVSNTSGTLAGRAGLESLKAAHANAGGFVTPRGAGMGMPLTWLFGSPRYKAANDPLLGISSSAQFATPVVLMATEGAAQSERSLTLTLDLPRAAVADALVIGPRMFH